MARALNPCRGRDRRIATPHDTPGPLQPQGGDAIALQRLVLIVTGAHLKAEVQDRPCAYRLRELVLQRLMDRFGEERHGRPHPLAPVVCSDLWYLNNESLRTRPTVSVGGPHVNALTAYLADKVPSVLAVEDVYLVQMDPELVDVVACCWGADGAATMAAVEAFGAKYLDEFLEAAVRVGAA